MIKTRCLQSLLGILACRNALGAADGDMLQVCEIAEFLDGQGLVPDKNQRIISKGVITSYSIHYTKLYDIIKVFRHFQKNHRILGQQRIGPVNKRAIGFVV